MADATPLCTATMKATGIMPGAVKLGMVAALYAAAMPTCGQPPYAHDLYYCGRGCPFWPREDP